MYRQIVKNLFRAALNFDRRTAALPIMFAVLLVSGCTSSQNVRGWGRDATARPSRRTLAESALHAACDLETIVPLAAAVAFGAGGWDQQASDWAIRHHPVFGSTNNADNAADALMGLLIAEAAATAALTPSGDDPSPATSKLKGFVVEGAAVGASEGFSELAKTTVHRLRPDGNDYASFYSGHATTAFSASTLANRNLDYMDMGGGLRTSIQATNLLLATGTAWARVEGGNHYPSDVLVGAALGHFLSAFIYDAFMDSDKEPKFRFTVCPMRDGAFVMVSIPF